MLNRKNAGYIFNCPFGGWDTNLLKSVRARRWFIYQQNAVVRSLVALAQWGQILLIFDFFFISWRFYILLKNVPWIRWDITKIIMRLQNSFCSIVVYLVQEVRYFYVKIKPPIKIKCRLQFSSSWYVLSGKGNAHHFPCMCWSPFWTISSSWSENFTILLRGHNGFNKLLESHFKFFTGIMLLKFERYACQSPKLKRKSCPRQLALVFKVHIFWEGH